MAVYIVTYDLNTPGKNYTQLLAAIKEYTNCKCLKSAFFIDSSEDSETITNSLADYIDSNDALYVMELREAWSANRQMPCTDWLQAPARTWPKNR